MYFTLTTVSYIWPKDWKRIQSNYFIFKCWHNYIYQNWQKICILHHEDQDVWNYKINLRQWWLCVLVSVNSSFCFFLSFFFGTELENKKMNKQTVKALQDNTFTADKPRRWKSLSPPWIDYTVCTHENSSPVPKHCTHSQHTRSCSYKKPGATLN